MSGIGESSGGGGAPTSNTSCSDLVITTLVTSPKEGAIARVSAGDVLDVRLSEDGATVVVLNHDGDVVGGLTSPLLQRLRECIDAGTEYQARVVARNDALIRVRVAAKK